MPVDYANGPREPASCFRIPRSSKIPKSIFSGLKSGLVDLLPHITGARREKKRSLFSQQQRTVEDSNMLRSNKDIVCVEPLANYLFSPCTRSESRGYWTESFSAYTLTIYYTVSGKAHLQLWKETPALPTSAAGLAEPVGCRLLICTSESVSLHTRDLRDNEGFVPHVHFLDCTKKTRKLREIALSIYFISFFNRPRCFPKPDSYIFLRVWNRCSLSWAW